MVMATVLAGSLATTASSFLAETHQTASCTAPPAISNFQLSDNEEYLFSLPWVQQFSFNVQTYGGSGFAGVYDDSGASSLAFSTKDNANEFFGSRGTNSWQPGMHKVHAYIWTDCGSATAELVFDFQLKTFDEPYAYGVYVPMGDSYSSGEANPPYVNRSSCHVSPLAWPSLMFSNRDGAAPYFEANLACSGAKIDDLFRTFKGQLSQVGQLEQFKPDIATVTIGGNDLGFGKILGQCFVLNCLSDSQFKAAKTDIKKLRPRLKATFSQISKVVPRLVVVGYPKIFPTNQSEAINCGWLTPKERTRLNYLTDKLDGAEQQAATDAGVEYVSVLDALQGHELCSIDSWLFKVNPACVHDSRCGHPLADGQEAIAKAVESVIG